jgi:ubiquinone/menaquinone biosynthesis C-methylase UbiE
MNNLPEYKSIDFYEKNAAVYDIERFFNYQGYKIDEFQKKIVVNLIGSKKDKRILDLGCGTGRFSIELENAGSHVISFDPSHSMLNELSKKEIGNVNIDLIQGLGHRLPFKEKSFDGCVCINVMDHIEDPKILIAEISRILKKDGVLVFNFSNYSGVYFPIALYINYTNKSLQNTVYTEWQPYHHIKKQLEASNFKVENVRGQLLFPKNEIPKHMFGMLQKLNGYLTNSLLKTLLGSIYIAAIKK